MQDVIFETIRPPDPVLEYMMISLGGKQEFPL